MKLMLCTLVACFLLLGVLSGCMGSGGCGPLAGGPRPTVKFDPLAVFGVDWETRGQQVRPAPAWSGATWTQPQLAAPPQYGPRVGAVPCP